MYFSKYAKHGAYHWRMYDDPSSKYRRHADRVREWVKEKNVLDIGAGDGKITHLCGFKGVDNEKEGVDLARARGADVIEGDAYNLPYADGAFDSACMLDVLEHLERPEEALQEARRIINDRLYITTPPKRPDGKLTDRFHYIEWTPEELKTLVEAQGFILEGEVLVIPGEKIMYAKFKKT